MLDTANSAGRKRAKLQQMRAVDMPRVNFDGVDIVVEDFVNARAVEIKALQAALDNSISPVGKRVFQTLPKLLRRRAASHNRKRLPFGLRKYSVDMSKSDGISRARAKKSKRIGPFRNRGTTSTHLWHAKRMKMVSIWGMRLADRPTEKSFHRLFRYSKHKAVIHDASYRKILTIVGSRVDLMERLSHIMDPHVPMLLTDSRLGHQFLYAADSYPLRLICPVEFMWIPTNGANWSLLLWVHCSCVDVVLSLCDLAVTTNLSTFQIRGPSSAIHVAAVFGVDEKSLGRLPTSFESASSDKWALAGLSEKVDALVIAVRNGFNLVLSPKYSRHIWNKFARRDVVAGGLRHERTMALENSQPHFPHDYVETQTCIDLQSSVTASETKMRLKYPPSKRSMKRRPFNVQLNAEPLPIKCNVERNYVIRSRRMLRSFADGTLTDDNAFVQMELLMVGKGVPVDGSEILLPCDIDSFNMPSLGILVNDKKGRLGLTSEVELKTVGYVTTGDTSLTLSRGKARIICWAKDVALMLENPLRCGDLRNLVLMKHARTKLILGTVRLLV
eukprot:Partr_v1_DN28627_c3_g2_i1_m49442 putative processing of precursor 1, ribonuclease P MRP subunit (S. cerevisiae)